ncbi:MAG TPA: SGNH/GDSL hydrolase family protein [Anaerolineae bacterium]|nr:SGNH/GDSL hydrolase family protein [Anaerolineae bacterium]
MKPSPGHSIRRTLVAIFFALVVLFVIVPVIYEWSGVRQNLEEQFAPIAPTIVARIIRKRPVAPPTPIAIQVIPVRPRNTPTPLPPPPDGINGVPIQRIVFLSVSTREHIRDIYALGQSLGRNPRSVSKVGDSTMVYPPFLATFDAKTYRLGRFAYLQPTIDFAAGSFGRISAAVKKGMHTWSQFDPSWVALNSCGPDEGPLACEIRQHNPSIAIIRLGANDSDVPGEFERNLVSIVKFCLARGIIPVLGTKPDHHEGQSNLINNVIRKTASAYRIPLWDYDLVAGTVPGRGLEPDLLHIRWSGTRDFQSPAAMRAGDALEDLTALMMLHTIRQEVGADLVLSK